MFSDRGKGKRMEREAIALEKRAERNGGSLSGKDRARLNRSRGFSNKYGISDEEDDTNSNVRGER